MTSDQPPADTSLEPHEWYGPCDGFGPYGECSICTTRTREFECFFNFLGWHQWSLGLHVDPHHPHLDVHLPGGFFRIGWYNHALFQRRPPPRMFAFAGKWKRREDHGC